MRIKQFCIEHRPLVNSLFWALMTIIILLFWPRPTIIIIDTPEVIIESPIIISKPIQAETPTQKTPRYGFTEEEIYLMTVLLSGSKDVDGDGEFDIDYGRDEEYDQISLVLCVVMNRVRSEIWPNTVSEVIWHEGQFSAMPKWQKKIPQVSDISLRRVTEWCKAYDAYDSGAQTIPNDHFYFAGDGKNNHSR